MNKLNINIILHYIYYNWIILEKLNSSICTFNFAMNQQLKGADSWVGIKRRIRLFFVRCISCMHSKLHVKE